MATTLTPNMSLTVPGAGSVGGPDYALEINNDLSILDGHDHTSGFGVQVPTAGININADFSLNGYNLTTSRTLRLQTQNAAPALAADLGCLYRLGNDLYYIDGAGNDIRITQSGSVSGSAGTITGLPSGTASASYAAGTFTFQSATATSASLDAGSVVLRNNTASSNGLTLSPPSPLATNYTLTLPTIPVSTLPVALDSSGNFSTVSYDSLATGMTTTGANNIGSKTTTTALNIVAIGGGALTVNTGTVSQKIVRGTISGSGTIVSGSGFSVSWGGGGSGQYDISFTSAFTGSIESVVATSHSGIGSVCVIPFGLIALNSFRLLIVNSSTGSPIDANFSFIAIGTP